MKNKVIVSILFLSLISLSYTSRNQQSPVHQQLQLTQTAANIEQTSGDTNSTSNTTTLSDADVAPISDLGTYLSIRPEMVGFDRTTSTDEQNDKMHFIIYADKTRIYAWDPLRRTKVRVIGNNFNNIAFLATDSDDSDNDFLFVADNNEENNMTTIYRFYILTNFSDNGQLSNEYYPPSILLDYTQKYTHWVGPAISGMCLNYDDQKLYFSVPTDNCIYKNEYDKGLRQDNNNHFGTIEKIYQNRKETTYITALDCNRKSDGLYWFNAKDNSTLDKQTMYRGSFDGDDDIEEIITHVKNPRTLVCDSSEDILYYFIGQDLWRYDTDNEDDIIETGKVRPDIGIMDGFFFWEDALYASDGQALYQVTDYYDNRIEPQMILQVKGVVAAAFFISDSALYFLSSGIVTFGVLVANLIL